MYCEQSAELSWLVKQIFEAGVGLYSCGRVGCNHMVSIEGKLVESHVVATMPQ